MPATARHPGQEIGQGPVSPPAINLTSQFVDSDGGVVNGNETLQVTTCQDDVSANFCQASHPGSCNVSETIGPWDLELHRRSIQDADFLDRLQALHVVRSTGQERPMLPGLAPMEQVVAPFEEEEEEEVGNFSEEAAPVRVGKDPGMPSAQERAAHEPTHLPYRSWCRACVEGRKPNALPSGGERSS